MLIVLMALTRLREELVAAGVEPFFEEARPIQVLEGFA